MQLLILGMHRSGTSATSRIINMMGAYFAPPGMEISASYDNPKGFWERKDGLEINNGLLALQGCAWNALAAWNNANASQATPELIKKMRAMIEEMDHNGAWFLKDPRLCLTLPAWLPLLQRPLAVIVYRHPGEIALSLHTRNRLPPEYAMALWEYYAAGALNATSRMPRIFVQYSNLLERPVRTAEALHQQLYLSGARDLVMPDAEQVRNFIDPSLYHERAGKKNLPDLSSEQEYLARLLQGLEAAPETIDVSESARRIIRNGIPGSNVA